MKKIVYITLCGLLLSCNVDKKQEEEKVIVSQVKKDTCKVCSIEILKNFNSQNESKIRNVVCTFETICNSNAEFLEMYDEVIYNVITDSPQIFLEVISTMEDSKKILILNKISTPLLDYNFDKILQKISNIKGFERDKKELINALEKAKKRDV